MKPETIIKEDNQFKDTEEPGKASPMGGKENVYVAGFKTNKQTNKPTQSNLTKGLTKKYVKIMFLCQKATINVC